MGNCSSSSSNNHEHEHEPTTTVVDLLPMSVPVPVPVPTMTSTSTAMKKEDEKESDNEAAIIIATVTATTTTTTATTAKTINQVNNKREETHDDDAPLIVANITPNVTTARPPPATGTELLATEMVSVSVSALKMGRENNKRTKKKTVLSSNSDGSDSAVPAITTAVATINNRTHVCFHGATCTYSPQQVIKATAIYKQIMYKLDDTSDASLEKLKEEMNFDQLKVNSEFCNYLFAMPAKLVKDKILFRDDTVSSKSNLEYSIMLGIDIRYYWIRSQTGLM